MQRPRTPINLSDSLHQRLNSYALAASAAGVTLLALAPPAEAKIVYTPAHARIGLNKQYNLDLDGMPAYFLWVSSNGPVMRVSGNTNCTFSTNDVFGSYTQSVQHVLAFAFKKGSVISSQSAAQFGTMVFQQSGKWFGHWVNAKNRYLGFVFFVPKHCSKHYGWARLSVKTTTTSVTGTLTGYAYETIPNKPIIAGKTHGKDVVTLEPATLGHLARGASAITAWRVKESK
jgi:hypothetical protein